MRAQSTFYIRASRHWSREGNGTPLQYSCLENPMDGGAWWATAHGVTKSWTWLSDFTFTFHFHALEKEMATHSSVLAWRIPGMGAWWAAVYGVTQSRTRLKWLSNSNIMATCCNRILYILFLCLWHKILCWNPRPAWLKFNNLTRIFLNSDMLFWFEG